MGKQYSDEEVICALMAHSTVREAAEALGCSRRTIYNYTSREDFKKRLREAQRARALALAGAIDNATTAALESMMDLLEGDSTGLFPDVPIEAKLEAARIVLSYESRRSGLLALSGENGYDLD